MSLCSIHSSTRQYNMRKNISFLSTFLLCISYHQESREGRGRLYLHMTCCSLCGSVSDYQRYHSLILMVPWQWWWWRRFYTLQTLISFSRDVTCPCLSPQSMYSALPGLLDGNPFSESGQLRVPDGLSGILEVLKEALKLLTAFQVHPDISLQLCAYLFFFINASLFNALMERGETSDHLLTNLFDLFQLLFWSVRTEISKQLGNGSPWSFAEIFMRPRRWILFTLVFLWLFMWRQHEEDIRGDLLILQYFTGAIIRIS